MLQIGVIRLSPAPLPVRIVLPATIALVPIVLWPHRRRPGVWLICAGMAANLAAIVANGGLMPIERATVERAIGAEHAAAYADGAWIEGSKDVLLSPGEGRLVALGDRFILRVGSGGVAASAGDFVIWAGMLALGAEAGWRWRRGPRGADTRETLWNRPFERNPLSRADPLSRAEG